MRPFVPSVIFLFVTALIFCIVSTYCRQTNESLLFQSKSHFFIDCCGIHKQLPGTLIPFLILMDMQKPCLNVNFTTKWWHFCFAPLMQYVCESHSFVISWCAKMSTGRCQQLVGTWEKAGRRVVWPTVLRPCQARLFLSSFFPTFFV